VGAVGSIGSIVGGIFLGQALIPVPVLGAFVGGLIGGFCGTKGVRSINKFMMNKEFDNIVKYLKSNVINEECWVYTPKILSVIGISKKYFN
jgi:phage tail tape-measure protein